MQVIGITMFELKFGIPLLKSCQSDFVIAASKTANTRTAAVAVKSYELVP